MLPTRIWMTLAWLSAMAPAVVLGNNDDAAPGIVTESAPEDARPPSPQQLDALRAQLVSPDAALRLQAAHALEQLPAAGLPLNVERLQRVPAVPPGDLRLLILEIWAQVPNPEYPAKGSLWLTKPEPPWVRPKTWPKGTPRPRRPPPHDPEQADWLTALAALDLDQNEVLKTLPTRHEARAQALETVALMHALAASRQAAAAEAIFDLAFTQEGVYRDECGRSLRRMGADAIPTLIKRQYAQGRGVGRQRRYALWQLDRMDRSRPQKAVETAPDDRLRAEILHAYGQARALDAVQTVLDQLDAASRLVRREARWAWQRYVGGPPPPPSPKRKRKLPGGKQEGEEKEDYLNYREIALIALDARFAELEAAGTPVAVPEEPSGKARNRAAMYTKALLDFYDARRGAQWDEAFRLAMSKQQAGDLTGAAEVFQSILLHNPEDPRRTVMAETFFTLGERRFASGDYLGARPYLEQSLSMVGDIDKQRRIQARIEAIAALSDGAASSSDSADRLRRALVLDPTLSPARQALAALEQRNRRRSRTSLAVFLAMTAFAAASAAFATARLVRVTKKHA